MQKFKRITKYRGALITVILALIVAVLLISRRIVGDRLPPPELVRHFTVFNTYGSIKIWEAPSLSEADQATEKVLDYLYGLHDTINVFAPESELSQLNQLAFHEPFHCSEILWDILQEARRAYEETNGLFDVTIGTLMRLWGFHEERESWPPEEAIKEALEAVGMDQIQFDDTARTVRFSHPDTTIDLGGIAKGYALDQVGAILLEQGIEVGMIDLGGDLLCLKAPRGTPGYRIGIRNPEQARGLIDVITVENRAVATSGNYENFRELDGRTVGHIINPKTGLPAVEVLSATVVAKTALETEIYATAITIGGIDTARQFVGQNRSRQVIMIRMDEDDSLIIDYLPAEIPNSGPGSRLEQQSAALLPDVVPGIR